MLEETTAAITREMRAPWRGRIEGIAELLPVDDDTVLYPSDRSGGNLQQFVHVPPHDFLKYIGRRRPFEETERFTRDTLPRHPRRGRIVVLADAAAMAVGAAAVAAEEQLVLMTLEKVLREL